VDHLPSGLSGLLIAAILAATMGTHSSAISALASSMTHDLYASYTGERDPARLLKIGKLFSIFWGVLVTAAALGFFVVAGGGKTPVVVFALQIASITYGGLLGAYLLAGRSARVAGRHVISGIAVAVTVMLTLFLTKSKLAWPWYVPLGSAITVATGLGLSLVWRKREDAP
jgi:SSS family solute:Na+ symporter